MDPEIKREQHDPNDEDSTHIVDKGAVQNTAYDERNGQFNRSFTPRQVHIWAYVIFHILSLRICY